MRRSALSGSTLSKCARRGLAARATAHCIGKRKADVLAALSAARARHAGSGCEAEIPAGFVDDFVTRLQVSMVQTQDEQCVRSVRRPLILKLNTTNSLLRDLLSGAHVEHWCRVFDATTRRLYQWYASVPDAAANVRLVCAGTVAVRFLFVGGSAVAAFLQHLHGSESVGDKVEAFRQALRLGERHVLNLRGGAYKPWGRGRSSEECGRLRSRLKQRLIQFLASPEQTAPSDPTFWMDLVGVRVQASQDTQFAVMQLAMDWYYSPIASHRLQHDRVRKLYYARGSGVCVEVRTVEAVENVARALFSHRTVRRTLSVLGARLEPFFTTEHALCGFRKRRGAATLSARGPLKWEALRAAYSKDRGKAREYAVTLRYLRKVRPLGRPGSAIR